MKLAFADDHVKLYQGDISEGIPLEDGEASAAVFSPPYNVDIAYDAWDDALPWDEYLDRIVRPTSRELARVLASGCRSWVNVAPVVESPPPPGADTKKARSQKRRFSLAARWAIELEEAGLRPCDQVFWTSQRGGSTAWGSYELPSAPNIRGDYEVVHVHHTGEEVRPGPDAEEATDSGVILFHFQGEYHRNVPGAMKGWRDQMGDWPRLVSNVWRIQPERRSGGHPAPYPVELAERCIRLSTWPGELVVDPFAGSGSTLIAARRLGRRAVGVELSEQYCERAIERLAAAHSSSQADQEPSEVAGA
jgi:site-specific DNA-methyltransferase (adenine-specific)